MSSRAPDRTEKELQERLRFETLVSDLSARFVNVPAGRLDGEIEAALKRILEFFRIDRCGMILVLPERHAWKLTHAAISESLHSPPVKVEVPVALFPVVYDTLVRRAGGLHRRDDHDEGAVRVCRWVHTLPG